MAVHHQHMIAASADCLGSVEQMAIGGGVCEIGDHGFPAFQPGLPACIHVEMIADHQDGGYVSVGREIVWHGPLESGVDFDPGEAHFEGDGTGKLLNPSRRRANLEQLPVNVTTALPCADRSPRTRCVIHQGGL